MIKFLRRDDFSEVEYAAIGRMLVDVTHLDDVIGRSAVKLLEAGHLTSPSSDREEYFKGAAKVVGSSGFSRFDQFEKIISNSGREAIWRHVDRDEIKNLMEWRNAICHGRFSRGSCGSIRIEFYDRSSSKNSMVPPEQCLSVEEAEKLSNAANKISFEISKWFLTP